MTFLLFQAFLLMAAAYFLGAFLGCWWRRTFFGPAQERSIRSNAEAVATAGAVTSADALNIPRSEPIPVQPRIEYVEAPEAIAERNRFERALSGAGSLQAGRPDDAYDTAEVAHQDEPPRADDDIAHFAVEPRSTQAGHEPTASSAPPHAGAPEIEPEPVPAAANVTDDAIAAAAAAAVAAAVGQRAAQSFAPPAEATPAPQATPVAASGGMAGVAADVRVPPLMPADSQDLKLIRNIDADVERILNGLGIWRYADIARWGHGDVAAVNVAVGGHARVQRENWVEQATVLAKGGLTAYARRRLRGEAADARPTEAARPSHGSMAAAPARAMPSLPGETTEPRTPSGMASAAAAAVAAAAASASRGRAASASSRYLAPVRAPRPVITELGEPRATVPEPAPTPPATAHVPPTTPLAPPAPAGTLTRSIADSLQRIRGIDAAAEHLLHDNGVTRYAQIVDWTVTEVEYFDELMEQPGRVSRENWIEQAQILARGGSTLFARQRDAGAIQLVGGAAAMAAAAASAASAAMQTIGEPRAARPSRLVDAMRQNQERAPAAQPQDQPEPQSSQAQSSQTQSSQTDSHLVRHDVAGLRSVRSEALRSDRFGGTAHAVDDLKRIRGIGVLIEKKLNSLGISAYDQIANWTAADVADVSEILDFRGRIERENWIEQARILSAGGQTEFSRRVDRGDAS